MRKTRSKKRVPIKRILLLIVVLIGTGVFIKLKFITDDLDALTTVVPKEVRQVRNPSDTIKKDSFSLLLLGIDTGEFGRVENGRSDAIMLATINKKEKQFTVVSIPRDSYVEIIGYDQYDKINHAYAYGGIAMTINTVQAYLDVPVDFFITLDMGGLEQIVDSIGGIDLIPSATFTQDVYTFEQGERTHLDGARALAYSRNRHADESGDYGRQARQREVIMGILEKGTNLSTLATKIPSVINSLQGNMNTNLSVNDMWTIVSSYSDTLQHIQEIQLKGEGQYIDEVYYEIIDEASLAEVQEVLQNQLDYHEWID